MPYSLVGLRVVIFPLVSLSPSWCRLSPFSWAGSTCSQERSLSISCLLVVSLLFSFYFPFSFFRINGLNDFTHAFMETWIFKKLWAAPAADRGVGESTANYISCRNSISKSLWKTGLIRNPSSTPSKHLVAFWRTLTFHLDFDLRGKEANWLSLLFSYMRF